MNVNIWLAQLVKLVLRSHNISSHLPDDSYSTLFFFYLSTCFFLITTLQWQIILVQGKGTPPSLNLSDLWVFFFITCMTPNFMSRLDRILQLNMKQIKFHLFSESKFACPSPLNEKPLYYKVLAAFYDPKAWRNLSKIVFKVCHRFHSTISKAT